MSRTVRCQAKNPETCKFHGQPAAPLTDIKATNTIVSEFAVKQETSFDGFFEPGTPQAQMFSLFKTINENLKDELCGNEKVDTVNDNSQVTSGFSYPCAKCGKIHVFSNQVYDKTTGGKAFTYLFRQLPNQYRNNQFLAPLMSIQFAALDDSFTHHYKDPETGINAQNRLKTRLGIAKKVNKVYDFIVVPPADLEDWTSHPGGVKEGLVYVEPENVPKELLQKFSQCLRKKQHATAEAAEASLVKNSQQNKEVYKCPHCKTFHYGSPIDPNRTEAERYEFVKKVWAMPAYREMVSTIAQTYKLQNK